MSLIDPYLLRFLTLLILVSGLSLRAQSNTPTEPLPEIDVAACLLFDDPSPNFHYRQTDGEYVPFTMGSYRRNRMNRVPPESPLVLYVPETNPEGETAWRPVLNLPLRPTQGSHLFIFHKTPELRSEYHLLTDPPGHHPDSSIRFLNLLGRPVAVMIGDEKFLLETGTESVVPLVPGEKHAFAYAVPRANAKPFESAKQRLRLKQGWRLLIVFATKVDTKEVSDEKMIKIAEPADFRIYDRTPSEVRPEDDRGAVVGG